MCSCYPLYFSEQLLDIKFNIHKGYKKRNAKQFDIANLFCDSINKDTTK